MRECTPLPLIAIGGINEQNLDAVLELGVDGIATISAILGAKDVVLATRALKNKINAHRVNL